MHRLILASVLLIVGCGGSTNPARDAVDASKAAEPATPATPTAPTPATDAAPAGTAPAAEAAQVYTCPMHPEVQQQGPGTCPKCKMALVPKGS